VLESRDGCTGGRARGFRASEFGDERIGVVVRETAERNYFASDIAYNLNSFLD